MISATGEGTVYIQLKSDVGGVWSPKYALKLSGGAADSFKAVKIPLDYFGGDRWHQVGVNVEPDTHALEPGLTLYITFTLYAYNVGVDH